MIPATDSLDSYEPSPTRRRRETITAAVWTGSEMIVWGGENGNTGR